MNAKEKKAREQYLAHWRAKTLPLLRTREEVIFLGSRAWLPITTIPVANPSAD